MLKQTSLYEVHRAAGARLVEFAGWEMPVSYGGILQEVRAVRQSAGIFDVSHMGEVRITGPAALAAVQRLLTNDASRLEPGRAQYSLMCHPEGGILDDLIVYRWDDEPDPGFLIVVNASNRHDDFAWMRDNAPDPDVRDVSDDYALLAVQGPDAPGIVQALAPDTDLSALRPFAHAPARFTNGTAVHLARTGYTGEDGFEVFCAWDDAPAVWEALTAAGAAPCGLGARDVLRLEASYPLYGHEINRGTNPYEAGLGWVVKPKKGDFIGRDVMLGQKAAGLPRRLAGLLPEDPRAIPREGAAIQTRQGDGVVTSGTFSPTLDSAIAMAYVPSGVPDGDVTFSARGRRYEAQIVPLPFYKRPA